MQANQQQLELLLSTIAQNLGIPDHVVEDATLKYEDVGQWLGAEDSELAKFEPEIYPQGSFRLGTTIRPLVGKDEYDIDLVCRLKIAKEATTQAELKKLVGTRLRKRDDFADIIEEHRRCWRLNYEQPSGTLGFHLDVLPTIPNTERPPTGILLTDTDLLRWQKSNPKAYAEWFYGRMVFRMQSARKSLAETLSASIEDVPEWRVRTPLQIAIQLLKRHRDHYFETRLDVRPVSMIITTLAAQAYENEGRIFEALTNVTQKLPTSIEKRGDKWWVANPVDPDENFADKWNEFPERQIAFAKWAAKAKSDFANIAVMASVVNAAFSLSTTLGSSLVKTAAKSMGLEMTTDTIASPLRPQVPGIAGTSHIHFPSWPIQQRFKANIKGSVHHIKSGKKLWPMEGRPVPKNVRLWFEVKTNTPQPYKVMWQVVNTGPEAAEASALRGEFYESGQDASNFRTETTSYLGTHWVEAFVIKDGICVARSGKFLVPVRHR